MELFLDNLLEVVVAVNGFLWNFLLLFILCGVGIYYTFKLKFIQVRKFGEGFRLVFGNLKLNGEKKEHGEMTPFQSLATAIAAQVGTGNLTGAATALLSGGPGLYSGCGLVHSLEWRQYIQKQLLLRNIKLL